MKQIRILLIALFALVALGHTATNRITVHGKTLFLSGLNLAWDKFSQDVGDDPININVMKKAIQDVRDSGGNSFRLWLFTNNAYDPKYDATTGLVTGLGTNTINNVKQVLDVADSNGVVVSLCLLSFDLMQNAESNISIANNTKMLTTDSGTTAFINNALVPLVTALKDHPAIMSWEIFNEPEGMIKEQDGWATNASDIKTVNVQRFVNKVAAAIKKAAPTQLVSSSAVTFKTSSKVSGFLDIWSDSALVAQGGDATGTLDFIQVHYYPDWGASTVDPFMHPASYWGLNKPIVLGEFPAASWSTSCMTSQNETAALQYAYDNGYAGAMGWSYNTFSTTSNGCPMSGSFTTFAPAMRSLFLKDSADIKIKNPIRTSTTGNGVMAVTLANQVYNLYPEIFSQKDVTIKGKTNYCFDVMVAAGATGTLKIQPVFKDSVWLWSKSNNYIRVTDQWQTICTPVSSFAVKSSFIKSMDIQFMAYDSTTTFSGTVLFDNVRLDTDTLYNFNDGFGLWSFGGDNAATKAIVTGTGIQFISGNSGSAIIPTNAKSGITLTQRNRTIEIQGNSEIQVKIADINGHLLLSKVGLGNLSLNLQDLHAGVYLVKITQGSEVHAQSITLH